MSNTCVGEQKIPFSEDNYCYCSPTQLSDVPLAWVIKIKKCLYSNPNKYMHFYQMANTSLSFSYFQRKATCKKTLLNCCFFWRTTQQGRFGGSFPRHIIRTSPETILILSCWFLTTNNAARETWGSFLRHKSFVRRQKSNNKKQETGHDLFDYLNYY